ncbi:hypothetical protein BC739_001135 [Kutzneria viridogrisea]|uniref:Uncharacterized protein n=1 Tax=Kutzneria viridogrisea TaxID=47990 RepID=A0ABR6BAM7_9PSEU|nr:hypothetical protein [Kutzneria albida]MBA8923938.1 hypothetical protein [Kutzneria viridogrisea]
MTTARTGAALVERLRQTGVIEQRLSRVLRSNPQTWRRWNTWSSRGR